MLTLRPFRRAFTGAALAVALLMPTLRARAVMADQMADASAPVDNPKTPGPDVFAGRNFDLVPDMPDPVAMDVATSPRSLPAPAPISSVTSISSMRAAERRAEVSTARGPPVR